MQRSDALCAAAKSKNLETLQRLISLKHGLTKTDGEGFSAIHYVVLSQWPEGLKAVIDVRLLLVIPQPNSPPCITPPN